MARLFYLPPSGPPYLFHAISAAPEGGRGTDSQGGRRWSVGFRLPDAEAQRLLAEVAASDGGGVMGNALVVGGPSGAPPGYRMELAMA